MVFPVQHRPHQHRQMNPHSSPSQLPSRQDNQPPRNHQLQRMIQGITGSNASVGSIATKGVNGLSKTIQNVQQVLNVVQSATPIVQEYGPMVKNLPAMYRMVKAFKDIEDTPEDVEQNNSSDIEKTNHTENKPSYLKSERGSDPGGQSTPKLFF